jgi:(S)-3,5-dihydroxyphenylglycine transaminase
MEEAAVRLDQVDLHPALRDSILSVPVFHTEVMGRFPDAISFAPGAPNLTFARGFDPGRHIETYLRHLCAERGLSQQDARNLLYEYGPSRGVINGLVAAALRRDLGLDVADRAVVITVGAQEGMNLVLHALLPSPDDLLAVVQPCFIGISGAARLLGVDMVPVNETERGVDLDGLAAACRAARAGGRRVRALYVAPDFNNPSGAVLDLPAREGLLRAAEEHDILLIEDGTYGFTAAPGAGLPALKELDRDGRVVALGTFAKICLPGARVGFVVADQQVAAADGTVRLLADELAKIKGMVTLNTPAISQAVIAGMLLEHDGSIAETGRAKSELYRRNLALLLEALDRKLGSGQPAGVSWNRPAGGFFVRMRLPVTADARLLEICAAKFGVLWTPMSQFYLDGSGTDEIRLSCSYLEPAQIEEGVARLADFLATLG